MTAVKRILVPISGGKDSQACLKLAVTEHGTSNVEGLFCDTQWEHPITYEHIDRLSDLYKVRIYRVTGGSVPEKVIKYKKFPVLGIRFCTDELKIRETRLFLKEYGECQVWYGMRLDESSARNKRYKHLIAKEEYDPHEIMPNKYPKYLYKMGIRFVLPILEWSTEDVLEYLNGEENPLYKQGFDRVGCFPCLAASDRQKEKFFAHDEFGKEQRKKVMWLENQTGKSVFTTQGARDREQSLGCSICSI